MEVAIHFFAYTTDPVDSKQLAAQFDNDNAIDEVKLIDASPVKKEATQVQKEEKAVQTWDAAPEPMDTDPYTPVHKPPPRLTHVAVKGIAKFNGYWMQQSDNTPMAHIENGILKWRYDNEKVHKETWNMWKALHQKVTVAKLNAEGQIVIYVEGESLIGDPINGMIVWSDGDTWQRDLKSESVVKYNGAWFQEGTAIAHIWDGSLKWLVYGSDLPSISDYKISDHDNMSNLTRDLKLTESGEICMDIDGVAYTGEIVGDTLVWSDGMKWTKTPGSQ